MSRWNSALERWKSWHIAARLSLLAGAAGLLAGLVLFAAVPGFVRSTLEERARGRGLTVELGGARVGWARIWLKNIVARDPALPGSQVELNLVELRLGFRGLRGVEIHGGQVQVLGSRSALEERWRTLRGRSEVTSSGAGRARRWGVEAHGIDIAVRDGTGGSAFVWGAALSVAPQGTIAASADLFRATAAAGSAEMRALEVKAHGSVLQRFEAARASARLRVDAGLTDVVLPAAPPRPAAAAVVGAARPGLVQRARDMVQGHVAPNFFGQVVALELEAARGRESIRIGPSRLSLAREGATLSVEVAAHPVDGGGTPLGLKARIPLEGHGGELEVVGGPVSLAALGVREGDFGLIGVREARLAAEAKVVLNPGGGSASELEVTSRGRIENARLLRPALAREELSGIGVGWSVSGSVDLDGSKLSIRNGELSLGEVRAELRGELEQSPARTQVKLKLEVPLASCSALFEALPNGAAPLLAGTELAGTFALRAEVLYDSTNPKATVAELEVKNDCRIPVVPQEISPKRFRRPWAREVEGIGGRVQIESGPGTLDWTPYEDISPHMETAILVCEDEGFFRHRGFAWSAIENSIQQNLVEGRFFRGGSTVSMQLAKNLYLGREKTLSRKLQEAVFTMILEQELSKHEIMELYLNVIEFGPGIYGIGPAARHYFNEEPRNLSLGQALYLGSILPNPDSHHFVADGRVSEKWSSYLRKLMQIAHKIRRISDEELELGQTEQVAFRKPNLLGEAVEAIDEAHEQELVVPELQ